LGYDQKKGIWLRSFDACAFDFSTNFDHQLFPQGQMADLMNDNINLNYLLVKLYYQSH
jgi:hypothetical protein